MITLDWLHVALYLIGGAYFTATTRVGFGWGRSPEEAETRGFFLVPTLVITLLWPIAVPFHLAMMWWRHRGEPSEEEVITAHSLEEAEAIISRHMDSMLRRLDPRALKVLLERVETFKRQRQATNMEAGE